MAPFHDTCTQEQQDTCRHKTGNPTRLGRGFPFPVGSCVSSCASPEPAAAVEVPSRSIFIPATEAWTASVAGGTASTNLRYETGTLCP